MSRRRASVICQAFRPNGQTDLVVDPLDVPGQFVRARPWPRQIVLTLEADFGRLAELWRRLDVALTTEPAPASAAALERHDWLSALSHDVAAGSMRVAIDHLVTWREIYAGGIQPTFAHLTLIRTAHETAWLAHWLMEPGIDHSTRLARGVAAQCDDYDERRKFEEAVGAAPAVPPAKSAADRLADLMTEATSRGLTRLNKNGDPILSTTLPSIVALFDRYEPDRRGRGSSVYRVLSGSAHGKQWATVQNIQASSSLGEDNRALVLVDANPVAAMAATQRAVNAMQRALDAFIRLRS
jgi:hypothetical protein